jgi:hypothetical protein
LVHWAAAVVEGADDVGAAPVVDVVGAAVVVAGGGVA